MGWSVWRKISGAKQKNINASKRNLTCRYHLLVMVSTLNSIADFNIYQLHDISFIFDTRCKLIQERRSVSLRQSSLRSSDLSTRCTSSSRLMRKHTYRHRSVSPSTSSRISFVGRKRVSNNIFHQHIYSHQIWECEALTCAAVQGTFYRHYPRVWKKGGTSQVPPTWRARHSEASQVVDRQRDLLDRWRWLQRVGLWTGQASQWPHRWTTGSHDRTWPRNRCSF